MLQSMEQPIHLVKIKVREVIVVREYMVISKSLMLKTIPHKEWGISTTNLVHELSERLHEKKIFSKLDLARP